MCTTCTPSVCRGQTEYWISWNCSYRCSRWCWKLNSGLLCRNSKSSLTAESSLQTHMTKLNKVHKYIFKILKSPTISFHYNKISYKSDRFYGTGTKSTGQLKEATLFTSHLQCRSQFDRYVSIQVWEVSQRVTLQHKGYQDCLTVRNIKGRRKSQDKFKIFKSVLWTQKF